MRTSDPAHPLVPLAARTLPRKLVWLLSIQIAALAVVVLVPFGFDRPSTLGLDFGHLLVLALLYGIAFLLGTLVAARERRWGTLLLQIALPAALVLLVATGSLAI